MAERKSGGLRRLFGTLHILRRRLTNDAAATGIEVTEAAPDDERRSLFDKDWYLATYQDIAAAENIDPFEHFVRHGEAEGRDPRATFSTTFYRDTYMADEAHDASPTEHYIRVGRNLGYEPSPSPLDRYASHLFAEEQSFGLEIGDLLHHIEVMTVRPFFIVFVDMDDAAVRDSIDADLRHQLYRDWAICTTRQDALRRASQAPKDDVFFIWLDAGDTLHPCALYSFASAINADPAVDLLYGDEDRLTSTGGRADPFYKPDWSPDYLEACNYVGSAACVRGTIAAAGLAESRSAYDFLLRITEQKLQVVHIRRVLVHRLRNADAPKASEEIASDIAALEGRLARTGRMGTVIALQPDRGCYDARLRLRQMPLVSVVIPTAGRIVEIGGRNIDLVCNCLQTVQERSSYKNLEFVIVDNGDIDAERIRFLHERGGRTITYDQREMNVARKLNIGAENSRGDFLLLLNDDVEPLTSNWIERLLEQFEKPNVGVVGAKLLYPNMTIQHAGVILNRGNPDHPRIRFPRDDEGYMFSTCAVRNFVAVTGAVMLTRATQYRAVGGYDERLAIAYNDVDFCLRLGERGLRAVYTPRAELLHHESLSRSRIVDQKELCFFADRWAKIPTDPFYNEENLAMSPASYYVHQNGRYFG